MGPSLLRSSESNLVLAINSLGCVCCLLSCFKRTQKAGTVFTPTLLADIAGAASFLQLALEGWYPVRTTRIRRKLVSLGRQGGDFPLSILNARRLSAIAKTIYTDGPLMLRKKQHWRPYVCPLERLIGHVHKGSRVLDIGCGGGLLLNLVAEFDFEFEGFGFDVSRCSIEVAKRAAAERAVALTKAKLSFECLEIDSVWPAGTFDVVFLVDVLHHVPAASQRILLRRAISKVKPSGNLVYKDMCTHPWWKAQANRLHDLISARELITYAPVQTVEQWANSEGMEIVMREDLSRFWYGHELRVMRWLHTRPQEDIQC